MKFLKVICWFVWFEIKFLPVANKISLKKSGTKSTYNPTKGNLTNIPAQIQVCMSIKAEVSKNATANKKSYIIPRSCPNYEFNS